jgi:hypothetical protein
MRTFVGPRPSKRHTVQHKDQNRSNNALSNLEYMTREEQMKDSYENNANRKSNADACSKPVEGRIVGADTWIPYKSAHEAASQLGLPHTAGISECCHKRQNVTAEKYEFRFAEMKKVLEGEVWRKVKGVKVSNMGRVETKLGIINYGSTDNSGYKTTGAKNLRIHHLVCRAFHGPPSSKDHTANHKDRNCENNHADNLEWSDKQEQARHTYENEGRKNSGKAKGVPLRARRNGGDWLYFGSISEAAEGLKLPNANITRAMRPDSGRHTAGGYSFEKLEVVNLPGEEWRDVVVDDSCDDTDIVDQDEDPDSDPDDMQLQSMKNGLSSSFTLYEEASF